MDELEERLNNYFAYYGDLVIIDNLELFYKLTMNTNKIFGKLENKEYEEKITKSSYINNLKLIKDFYKKYKIENNLDKQLQDGTIELLYNDYDSIELGGVQKYENNKKIINVNNNGLLIDSSIMVHELSHLYDAPNNENRNTISNLLTEAIAYTYQLIYTSYLNDLGYKEDSKVINYETFYNLVGLSNTMESIYRIMITYKNMSDIKKDSYFMYYLSEKDYNKDIEVSKNNMRLISDFSSWFTLAIPLMTYMYYRFKENNEFINKIKKLQNSINNSNMLSCLKTIELTDLGNHDKDIFGKYMVKSKKELNG